MSLFFQELKSFRPRSVFFLPKTFRNQKNLSQLASHADRPGNRHTDNWTFSQSKKQKVRCLEPKKEQIQMKRAEIKINSEQNPESESRFSS